MKNNVKVQNMKNEKGRDVVNQFLINDYMNGILVFQSYNTTIYEYDYNNNKLTITSAWDYSKTTSKYFYQFINNQVYGILDMDGVALWQGLQNAKNKKAYILKLIDKGIIECKGVEVVA